MTQFSSKHSTIAIIGAGFSGLSVLYHLVEKASKPFSIYLVEKSNVLGTAFGTKEPCHPLNVRANNMGAFASNPEDFYQWLTENEKVWKTGSDFEYLAISPSCYLPRKLFGLYLTDVLSKTFTKASQKNITIEMVKDELTKVNKLPNGKLQLKMHGGALIETDYTILAIGVNSTKKLPFESASLLENPNYVRNIWDPNKNSLLSLGLDDINNPNFTIAILGTGLTTVDAILSLMSRGYKGKIVVISRSGRFPQPHLVVKAEPIKLTICETPKNSLTVLKELRGLWDSSRPSGANWRDLIDGIRPHTVRLWQSFDPKGKRQFLRHVFSFWNHHRHRMSPNSQQIIDSLIKAGKLEIITGKILKVESGSGKLLEVHILSKDVGQPRKILANQVFNCTGLAFTNKDPLIQNLLDRGIILPDELGMGLKIKQKEILAGDNSGNIFALGSLLFGERFETIAVPEIRVQAASIAETICQAVVE